MKKYIKKIITVLVILFSVNSFGSLISSNDGSGLVTKEEFSALKEDITYKVENYESNINKNIDGAIIDYLDKLNTNQELDSILNKSEQYFVKDFDVDICKEGSHVKYCFNICMMAGYIGYANAFTQLQIITGSFGMPNVKEVGTDADNGIYYYGEIKDTVKNYFSCTKKLNYLANSSVSGSFTSGSYGDTNACTSSSVSMADKIYKLDGDYFAVEDDTYLVNMGGVDVTWPVMKAFSNTDTFEDFDVNMLPGKKLPNQEVYFVDSKEVNMHGSERNINGKVSPENVGVELCYASGGCLLAWTTAVPSIKNKILLTVYNHKYHSVHWNQCLNEKITNMIGKNVFLYNGIPIFKTQTKGHVFVSLYFENSDDADTVFMLSKTPFNDEDVDVANAVTTYDDITKPMRVTSDNLLRFEIDGLESGGMYWIKAMPLSGKTQITTQSIKFEKDIYSAENG